MSNQRLTRENALLAVIDVQERLAPVIHEIDSVVANIERLIRGTHVLGVPMLITEQYVKGLGSTVSPIKNAIDQTHAASAIEKMCFSSLGCEAFAREVKESGRRQIILAGVETHVCVYQTALDLLAAGHSVYVVADAVSSRTERNRDIALQRMMQEGARLASTEMALLEMTVNSGTDEFRAISKLIK